MLLSVITVTYNAAAFLEQTLKSVADQTFKDFEHIVWDGGSRDNTLDIARSFPHVRICRGKDSGISDAMNKGAFLAKGKFLLHLHADDVLVHKDVFKMVATALSLHPSFKWLYGRAHIIDGDNQNLRTTPYELFSKKRLRKYNFITHPTVYIEREFFLQNGGFEKKLRYCMDYAFWLRLSQKEAPLALNAVLASFREHPNSLSTSQARAVADEAYKVRNRYVKNLYERWRSYLTWRKRSSASSN